MVNISSSITEHSQEGCLGQKHSPRTVWKSSVSTAWEFFLDNHICLCAVITGKPEVYSCVHAWRRVLAALAALGATE